MSWSRQSILWPPVALLTLFVRYAPSSAAPTPLPKSPAVTPQTAQATEQPRGMSTPAKAQIPSLTDRAWWNQPELIKAVQLKDEQRTKMDALLTRMLDAQRAGQQAQGESQKALEEALAKGEWDAARQAAARLREGMANLWAAQTTLKIDVLSQL